MVTPSLHYIGSYQIDVIYCCVYAVGTQIYADSKDAGLDARRQTFVPVGIYTIWSTIGWHARVLGGRRQGNTKTDIGVIATPGIKRQNRTTIGGEMTDINQHPQAELPASLL